ncbi:fatty acyl-AMP ligase [Legionella cardiaca]|uniref:Fatty acyl-AMP ligase n=1 Tax=Legionella cardiaca TaxID=1071983 RepID=A0ABY8AQA2_9GAMM|nr:fatty acyl-AMP ligase [Legionella cardiaca]WED42825.1 fatty acyl-AMP ligase [Legionella cardiaca]
MAIATITQILKDLCKTQPALELYRFIENDETVKIITPVELDHQAKKIAAKLQKYQIKQKTAVLLYEPSCEYIFALFGCLYAGVIAVPAYPPITDEMATTLKKIIDNADAKIVLTSQKISASLRKLKVLTPLLSLIKPLIKNKTKENILEASTQLNQLKILTSAKISDQLVAQYKEERLCDKDIAYLQYTSGSTSKPKGVVITHQNLMANLQQLVQDYKFTRSDVVVTWLPPYHDMGLISGIFIPLFVGIKSIHLSPINFLQKPLMWLKAISDYQGTVAGGPDFSFRLCSNKIKLEGIKDLNLASWRIAFCGAETVHSSTFPIFYNKFARYSLKENIFIPCYGLAESVVYVCGVRLNATAYYKNFNKKKLIEEGIAEIHKSEHEGKRLVSVGFCSPNAHVQIVNPDSQEIMPDGHVGEIWFHGPNAATAYWRNSEDSQSQLNARIKNAQEHRTYVRTGDLGFKYQDELFITGRIKDLIIINGLNHYPQDLELSVREEFFSTDIGSIAAFAVNEDDCENVIMLVEHKKSSQLNSLELSQKVHEIIREKHLITIKKVLLVPAKTIPKTTSGKIKRAQCREYYVNGRISCLFEL